jgi:hypothetical protein
MPKTVISRKGALVDGLTTGLAKSKISKVFDPGKVPYELKRAIDSM